MATGSLTVAGDTVNFDVLSTGMQRTYGLDLNETRIQGGSITYVEIGGKPPDRFKIRAFIAEPSIVGLKIKRGKLGTLVTYRGTESVLLLPFQEGDYELLGGIRFYTIDLEFILASS